MKTHLNLGTRDLDRSVAFYSVLLDSKPVKHLADYALFITEDPGLELALDLRDRVEPTLDAHFGIYVETADEVELAIGRLQDRGLDSSVERAETCCYANQTKVWANDPEGRRWEIYTVHEDVEARVSEDTSCCVSDGASRACCPA